MRGRWLAAFLVFAAGAAVLQALLAPPPSSPADDPRPSVLNTAPAGTRALFLWLDALGYPTRALRRPLTSLGSEQQALFVLEPSQEVTPDQAAALFAWVEAGGALFLAPGFSGEVSVALEDWIVLELDETDAADVRGDRIVPGENGEAWRYREAGLEERGLYERPVDEVAVLGPVRVADPDGEHSLLFARGGLALLAEIFHGDGVVVVLAEPDLLTNRGLPRAGNAELALSVIEDWVPAGTVLWFDEYDHGARVAGSLPGYLLARRPGLFAAAGLGAFLLAVLRWRRTLVVTREEGPARRRRPAEFVDALGSLYARSRAAAPAWSALAQAARRIARGELAGVGSPAGREALAEALRRGASARTPSERELLQLARTVAGALQHGKERR